MIRNQLSGKAILADEKKLLGVIKDELLFFLKKYGDERKILWAEMCDEVTRRKEHNFERENIVIAMTKLGYMSS